MLRKKGQQQNLSFKKQSTQSTYEKYDEKLTSTQDLVSYGRNPSCSCYISHLLKARDISIVFGLNNFRTVLKLLQNPGFQTEYLAVSTKRLSKSFSNDFSPTSQTLEEM